MAVPTTNINFSDIALTADATYSGILSLNTMSFFSYFTGPNGSSNQPYNNWGQGEASGANRIYGTTAKTTNIKVGDFSGLSYFYDGSTTDIYFQCFNNSPFPITPPDPPDCYDMNVSLTLTDSNATYTYCSYGGLVFPGGGSFPSLGYIAIPGVTPLINTYYWSINISPAPSYPGSSGTVPVRIDINGTTVLSGVTINAGANIFDFTTYGTEVVTSGFPSGYTAGGDFLVSIN
jgi:hypothetical protein